ncbi:hypothetical protein [Hungatella hathewayi]|uniref:hypothetical protein n=1 Tax=Hungatella hathewayi TaxID=154046 RepID=UPI001A99FB3C|nr:hypothetical protein [Hungatella hathewayi]
MKQLGGAPQNHGRFDCDFGGALFVAAVSGHSLDKTCLTAYNMTDSDITARTAWEVVDLQVTMD